MIRRDATPGSRAIMPRKPVRPVRIVDRRAGHVDRQGQVRIGGQPQGWRVRGRAGRACARGRPFSATGRIAPGGMIDPSGERSRRRKSLAEGFPPRARIDNRLQRQHDAAFVERADDLVGEPACAIVAAGERGRVAEETRSRGLARMVERLLGVLEKLVGVAPSRGAATPPTAQRSPGSRRRWFRSAGRSSPRESRPAFSIWSGRNCRG